MLVVILLQEKNKINFFEISIPNNLIMTKLKIFKELLVCLVVVVIIRFTIAKLFQKEFSFFYSILVGIAIYVGGYFTTRKK